MMVIFTKDGENEEKETFDRARIYTFLYRTFDGNL